MKVRYGIVIFVLALAVRIFFILSAPPSDIVTDAKDYDSLGWRVAQGHGYVNHLGQPTAYRPPVYPLFVALVYRVAGHQPVVLYWLQACIGAGICLFVFLLGWRLFNPFSAKLAGFISVLYLPLIVQTTQILSELLFTLFLVITIYLMVSREGPKWHFFSGVLFGLSLLTRPFAIFIAPVLLIWLTYKYRSTVAKPMLIFAGGVLLILSPWVVRNFAKMDAFVPFSNVGGLTLFNSYVVPERGFGYNSYKQVGDDYYEIKDETGRSKYLVAQTVQFIVDNPGLLPKLVAAKVLYFVYPFDGYWHPMSYGSKFNIFWSVVICFGAYGILLNQRTSGLALILVLFVHCSFLIGVIVFYGSPRFRLPLEPFLICFAAFGAQQSWQFKKAFLSFVVMVNLILFSFFRYFELSYIFKTLNSLV